MDGYRPEGHVSLDALLNALGKESGKPKGPDQIESELDIGFLRSEGMTLLQVEKQVRMKKVLAAMRDEDVDLLMDRFVQQRTVTDIAEDLRVSTQAVYKRLDTAKANFMVAFAEHWEA